MSFDMSRYLHQPIKHYAAARLQQGRVIVDSDHNEGVELLEEELRHLILDALGPNGSPDAGLGIGRPFTPEEKALEALPEQTPGLTPGSALAPESVFLNGEAVDIIPVTVRAGSMYLSGQRVELPRAEMIAFQRDFLQFDSSSHPVVDSGNPGFKYLYYLIGWDQSVSALEDDEMLEVMLKGSDSSIRKRQMRRVEIFSEFDPGIVSVRDAFAVLVDDLQTQNATFEASSGELKSNGRLQLVFAEGSSADPCAPCEPNRKRYLGEGNEALKILLTSENTYVWSLDAGGPLFRVRLRGLDADPVATLTVEMLTPPKSERELPLLNRVVEFAPFAALLEGGDLPEESAHPHAKKVAAEVGVFGRVSSSYDVASRSFEIEATTEVIDALRALVTAWDPNHPDAVELNAPDDGTDARYLYLRMWHEAPTAAEIELPTSIDPSAPGLGDTGVVPLFHQPGRRGDFWIAALRPDTPNLIVPYDLRTNVLGVPPHGPRRFLTPVALIDGDGAVVQEVSDGRRKLRRTTDDSCITYTVGDSVDSSGDFRSIQEAINALPSEGGRIAVRPGTYFERVRVDRRRNVVIEGCGESTVIESPRGSYRANLVEISNSEAVTFTGFRLHAANQIGLRIRNTVEALVSDVSFISGLAVAEGFSPGGSATPSSPLLQLERTSGATIRDVVLDTSQRAGLFAFSSELLVIEGVTASGSKDTGPAPTRPMVLLSSVVLGKFRDSTLVTFGQVGVEVRGGSTQDLELSHLIIDSAAYEQGTVFEESRSGIDVQAGTQIVIDGCQLSMEATVSDQAAVVLRGTDVILRESRIEALESCFDNSPPSEPEDCNDLRPLAWGGVEVRGGSERITISGNRIRSGVGHGITLGSLIWEAQGSPGGVRRGPGRSQLGEDSSGKLMIINDVGEGFADAGGETLRPSDEGPISEITVTDNRIEGFFGNGVSVVTVLGLRGHGGRLVELRRGRIEGNVITGNLRGLSNTLPRVEFFPFPASREGRSIPIPSLPFGGIVLGAVTGGMDVRNNTITDNSGSAEAPITGIFVFNGDSLQITGNRILNNGKVITGSETLAPGVRAGIAVMLAGTGDAATLNQVSPVFGGHATLDSEGSSLRISGNTVVQPEGRALYVVGTGPIDIEGNYFGSQGFHGSTHLVDRFKVGDVVFVQNMGMPWESFDIGSQPLTPAPGSSPPEDPAPGSETTFQDWTTPAFTSRYLLNSVMRSPRFFFGEGGRTAFQNNQVVLDWTVKRLPPSNSSAPISFFPVAVLGLDHVSVSGNQMGLRLDIPGALGSFNAPQVGTLVPTEPIFSQLLVMGGTLEVSRNRVSSGIGDVFASIVTFSELMSAMTLNQSTHVVESVSTHTGHTLIEEHNQVVAMRGFNTSALRTGLEDEYMPLLRLTTAGDLS